MANDPSVPARDGKCHLLRLSGELRNIIYSRLLHEHHGLRYVNMGENNWKLCTRAHDAKANSSGKSEANQIMYTCRQLHQETRGLGPANNDLYFDQHTDAAKFLQSYGEAHHYRLRNLYISQNATWLDVDIDCLKATTRLCRDHPHLKIWIRSGDLRQGAEFILVAASHEILLRGTSSILDRCLKDEHDGYEVAQFFRQYRDLEPLRGDAYPRIVPYAAEFDEKEFRQSRQSLLYDDLFEHSLGSETGGVDVYVGVIRDVFKNGI